MCTNEYSPADGHVVAMDFGCGGHSEAAVVPDSVDPGGPVVDEFAFDRVQLHPTGSVPSAAAAAPEAPQEQDEAAASGGPAEVRAEDDAGLGHA